MPDTRPDPRGARLSDDILRDGPVHLSRMIGPGSTIDQEYLPAPATVVDIHRILRGWFSMRFPFRATVISGHTWIVVG